MLQNFRAATMIPSKDLSRSKDFYEGKLGFSADEESPEALIYRSADTQFNVYSTQAGGGAEHTLIGWLVDDIESVVDQLNKKGVTFEQYDFPGFRTDAKGIAEMGEEKGAWFKDPDDNILSLWQLSK